MCLTVNHVEASPGAPAFHRLCLFILFSLTFTLLSGLFKCLPKLRPLRPRKQKPVEKASGTRERTPPPLTDVNDSLNDPLPTIYDPQPTPRDRAVGGEEVPTTAPPLEQQTGFRVRALLDEKQLQQLWRWLPAREHTKDARIVYCTGTHGRSLQTLYRKARNEWGHRQGNSAVLPAPESLLIIKTTLKDVVGAYLTRWPRIPELDDIQASRLIRHRQHAFSTALPPL